MSACQSPGSSDHDGPVRLVVDPYAAEVAGEHTLTLLCAQHESDARLYALCRSLA